MRRRHGSAKCRKESSTSWDTRSGECFRRGPAKPVSATGRQRKAFSGWSRKTAMRLARLLLCALAALGGLYVLAAILYAIPLISGLLDDMMEVKFDRPDRSIVADYGNGLTPAQRESYYHLSQGSEIMPWSLLTAVADANSTKPFVENLERYGLLPEFPRGAWRPARGGDRRQHRHGGCIRGGDQRELPERRDHVRQISRRQTRQRGRRPGAARGGAEQLPDQGPALHLPEERRSSDAGGKGGAVSVGSAEPGHDPSDADPHEPATAVHDERQIGPAFPRSLERLGSGLRPRADEEAGQDDHGQVGRHPQIDRHRPFQWRPRGDQRQCPGRQAQGQRLPNQTKPQSHRLPHRRRRAR